MRCSTRSEAIFRTGVSGVTDTTLLTSGTRMRIGRELGGPSKLPAAINTISRLVTSRTELTARLGWNLSNAAASISVGRSTQGHPPQRPSPSPASTAASSPRADQSSSAQPRATSPTRRSCTRLAAGIGTAARSASANAQPDVLDRELRRHSRRAVALLDDLAAIRLMNPRVKQRIGQYVIGEMPVDSAFAQ